MRKTFIKLFIFLKIRIKICIFKIFLPRPTKSNGHPLRQMNCNLVAMVYRRSSTKLPVFFADQTSNMADMGNTCFWLVEIRKISPLKLQGQMKYNLVGIMYGRFRTQIPNVVPIILKHGCHGNTCFWLVVVRLSGEPHSLSSLSLYIRQKIYHVLHVILFWRNKPNQTINFITYYGGTCLERPLLWNITLFCEANLFCTFSI